MDKISDIMVLFTKIFVFLRYQGFFATKTSLPLKLICRSYLVYASTLYFFLFTTYLSTKVCRAFPFIELVIFLSIFEDGDACFSAIFL